MKEYGQASPSSTANLVAAVRASLKNVRDLLVGGRENAETRAQVRQLELLEQLLVDQDARLGSFDRVLEEFNFSVAHELCAPLRRIAGFTREILLRCGEELDPEGMGCLNQILESSQQMNDLIDALMQISRISHLELQRAEVDLSEMAGEIAEGIAKDHPERTARFVIQPRLHCTADPSLLRTALGRLLENAWYFTADREPALIEVGSLDATGQTAFFVQDNGIGFDPGECGRLFHPFQHLHDRTKYPGSGLGLTTVKKVIDRHGGRIWAEGKPGTGATFYFTVPG